MSAFFFRGKGSAFFVPTIANPASPTATEINAGTNLSKALTAVSGFVTQLNRISTPILAYSQEIQTTGPQQFVDSQLTIITNDGTGTDADSVAYTAAAAALVDGATGNIVFCPAAATIVAGKKVFVFPALVGAANPSWTLDAALSTTIIDIVLTSAPSKNVTVA